MMLTQLLLNQRWRQIVFSSLTDLSAPLAVLRLVLPLVAGSYTATLDVPTYNIKQLNTPVMAGSKVLTLYKSMGHTLTELLHKQ